MDRHRLWAVSAVVFLVIGGCTILPDQYASRVIDYNLEAERAQEQELLLNIVRASLRRPMQFTGLQSITGNAQGSVNSTLSLPFGSPAHRPPKSVSPDVLGLGASLSGGPQFTVPVLDTQEFYEGILRPINLQVFDYYLQQGFPREMLYDLFIQKIVITKKADGESLTFENNVLNDIAHQQFNLLLEYLLASGLTTEHISSSAAVGAPIAAAELEPASRAEASQLIEAYAKAASASLGIKELAVPGTPKVAHPPGAPPGSALYSVEKNESSVRFCFAPHGQALRAWLSDPPEQVFCNAVHQNVGVAEAGIAAFPQFKIPTAIYRALDALQHQPGAPAIDNFITIAGFENQPVALQFYVRSTQGIMYYLGEVLRRAIRADLNLSAGTPPKPLTPQIMTFIPFGMVARTPCPDSGETRLMANNLAPIPALTPPQQGADATKRDYYCENLFRVDAGGDAKSFLSVDYEGTRYAIPANPKKAGRTFEVLELVKQLFAINTSAKEFPSTSVFSIISAP